MINLSFFAKDPYLKRRDNHLVSGSSIIRAKQIAEYLGAKYNPVSGYENDVCIYVKPINKNIFTNKSNKKKYIDIIDNKVYIKWLQEYPDWFGIVASEYGHQRLETLLPNRIIFIPQQHCNFERVVRERKKIVNVGIIGSNRDFQYPIEAMRERLKKIGLQLIVNFDFKDRADVVNFYKNIDIQIIWRTKGHFLVNPLKIINAASFGIPTVAYAQRGYKEVYDYFIKVQSIDEIINKVQALKDPKNYETAIKNLLQMAENYHISKIAEMYNEKLVIK